MCRARAPFALGLLELCRNALDQFRCPCVAIDDGTIIAVGPAAEINAAYAAVENLEAANRVVMPGLVNGHSHAAMSLFRGIADDLALMDWLNDYMFPAEVEFADEDFVRLGTELACWEMIRGGTTTFVDMYYFPDTISEVVESCGMRAMISATIIDKRSPDAENAADSLRKGRAYRSPGATLPEARNTFAAAPDRHSSPC